MVSSMGKTELFNYSLNIIIIKVHFKSKVEQPRERWNDLPYP